MAEKNQQNWRLIQKLEQRSAALSAVLPAGPQPSPSLPLSSNTHLSTCRAEAGGNYLATAPRLPSRQPQAGRTFNGILKGDAVILRHRCHRFFRGRDSMRLARVTASCFVSSMTCKIKLLETERL